MPLLGGGLGGYTSSHVMLMLLSLWPIQFNPPPGNATFNMPRVVPGQLKALVRQPINSSYIIAKNLAATAITWSKILTYSEYAHSETPARPVLFRS